MRHRVAGRNLSRTSAHRKSLFRNMAGQLIQHESIKTTEAKAKELRRYVEKLITLAKKGTLHARRRAITLVHDQEMLVVRNGGQNPDVDIESLEQTIIQKLFNEIGPRYANRPGGYTRIIRLADKRIGDGGKQVILQLVEEEMKTKTKKVDKDEAPEEVSAEAVEEDVVEDVVEEEVVEDTVSDESVEETKDESAE